MTAPQACSFRAELWVWDARRHDRWTFVSPPVTEVELAPRDV